MDSLTGVASGDVRSQVHTGQAVIAFTVIGVHRGKIP